MSAVMQQARRFDEGVLKSILETAVDLGGETVNTVEQPFNGMDDEKLRDILMNMVETDSDQVGYERGYGGEGGRQGSEF